MRRRDQAYRSCGVQLQKACELQWGVMALTKIVSGGQTGVDRGALDAALVAGFACGGWCPANRAAEDGEIPERYPLTLLPPANAFLPSEDPSARQVAEQYRARTLKNVQDSDGTAILL
jgi:hypothetical protein